MPALIDADARGALRQARIYAPKPDCAFRRHPWQIMPSCPHSLTVTSFTIGCTVQGCRYSMYAAIKPRARINDAHSKRN